MRDELFQKPLKALTEFEFNDEVAAVFDDMIHRSIPFYDEVQKMVADFVDYFYRTGSDVVDLGCSTGTTIAYLAKHCQAPVTRFLGIDDAPAMLSKARSSFKDSRIEFVSGDIRHVDLGQPSVVLMNYTLQFVRPLYRQHVLNRIHQALSPGGILILSEKVLEDATPLSRLFMEMYWKFKRRQGYSDMEISRKRDQLENVLIPYTATENREMLQRAGFAQSEIFFKWHNFASFIAIKDNP